MKRQFPGYYKPTSAEFAALWNNCIFVLDTNVLLKLYRYSPTTRRKLFDILHRLDERLWIPHQVAFEFHENRLEVIYEQQAVYSEIRAELEKIENVITVMKKGHPFINESSLFNRLSSSLRKHVNQFTDPDQPFTELLKEDNILEEISHLFDGRVGEPSTSDRLAEIYLKGAKRYELKVPPGFKDAKKQDKKVYGNLTIESKYGDLIIWFQTIDKVKSDDPKRPVIFVTDDDKEDWWWDFKGQTKGPRPELINEFNQETGTGFYMYQTESFIQYAKNYFGLAGEEQSYDSAAIEAKSLREFDDQINSIKQFSEDIQTLESENVNNLDQHVAGQPKAVSDVFQRYNYLSEQSPIFKHYLKTIGNKNDLQSPLYKQYRMFMNTDKLVFKGDFYSNHIKEVTSNESRSDQNQNETDTSNGYNFNQEVTDDREGQGGDRQE